MTVSATKLNHFVEIQKDNGIEDNKLILLLLSLSAKRKTEVSAIANFLGEEEFFKLREILEKDENITKSDYALLENVSFGNKKPTEDKYSESIDEVLNHLYNLNPSLSRLKSDRALVKSALQKGFSVSDLKMVNYFFFQKWKESVEYSKYIRPATIFATTKLERNVSEAKPVLEKIRSFASQILFVCSSFETLVFLDLPPQERPAEKVKPTLVNIPFTTQKAIVHWLTSGYNAQIIEMTIRHYTEEWAKNNKGVLLISKIIDDRFPERAKVIEKLFVEKQRSTKTLDDWATGDTKTLEAP